MTQDYELNGSEVAVVGMAARLPGARNVDEFWRNLRDGVEAVQFYTDDQLREMGVEEALLRHPNYVRAGAPLADVAMFDAAFFGFSPQEATIMDPQHRHFLEVAWEALEHAGYDSARYDGAIGLYGGSGMNAYMPFNLFTNPQLMKDLGLFWVRHTGNDKDFLTTRVSYLLDLKGPSVNVQTACSTSLVATHLAVQALAMGEVDMALAGGVTIEQPHGQGYLYREGEVLSPDGHCRAFDIRSQGTVFGSGAGVIVLKRLDDALEDGDTIHALIKGSAINNDGSGKVNYFAPSVDGQADVIAEALAVAQVEPETISYVEAHGTGTPIGDPIEIAALKEAFNTPERQYCAIGSVKTNIGHLDTAAGVAGMVKTILTLKNRQIPPSLNFQAPNPALGLENSPFYVNATLQNWTPPNGTPRRAGISSLGVGGTNAHIVFEEAPPVEPSSPASRSWQVFALSARTETALNTMTDNLVQHLQANPDVNLADVAYTLQVGRHEFEHRRVFAGETIDDIVATVQATDRKHVATGKPQSDNPQIAFMFPGGGAHYINMGRDLYDQEPVYREVVDDCLQRLKAIHNIDLQSLMFPAATANMEAVTQEFARITNWLPAMFITNYALAQLWRHWGLEPVAMIGHSLGEYVAACLAGVLTLDDALRVVQVRAQLMETMPEGAMLSVPLSEAAVRPYLNDNLSLGAVNGPELCAISGEPWAIEDLQARLEADEIEARRLVINVAAHSHMFDPILDDFLAGVQQVNLQPPTMPYVSNITGDWITPQQATDPAYWVQHLRQTVRFSDCVATLTEAYPDVVLLEVGPGTTLSSLARMRVSQPTVSSLRHPRDTVSDMQFFLTAFGRLWVAGVAVDWSLLYEGERRYRIPLPTYAFDHKRYWIEPGKSLVADRDLTKSADLDDWFYTTRWDTNPLHPKQPEIGTRWLVFVDDYGLGSRVVDQLQKLNQDVTIVTRAIQSGKRDDHHYTLDPKDREGCLSLIGDLSEAERLPHKVLYFWPITDGALPNTRQAFYEEKHDLFFDSLLYLAQALSEEILPQPLELNIISNNMHTFLDDGPSYPEKAVLLGLNRVIPHELPDITCRSIDVDLPKLDFQTRLRNAFTHDISHVVDQLLTEVIAPADAAVVAYRRDMRWTQSIQKRAPAGDTTRLREGGVYLITGGLGGIGLIMAESLAQNYQAKLVLVSRRALPPENEWDEWVTTHPANNATSKTIVKVRNLQHLGADVLVVKADVTQLSTMRTALSQTHERFGPVNGVIHAAGVIDDALIAEKTLESALSVLNPKVVGTLVLADVFANEPLDFMVLFSSTSALLGLGGQADYAGANAFLDAFAHSRAGEPGPYIVALNWGTWSQVGMTAPAETTYEPDEALQGYPDSGHPLLGKVAFHSADRSVYMTQYTEADWFIDEHRLLDDSALLPGTGYLEIARAALATHQPPTDGTVMIEDLYFLLPLGVSDQAPQPVHVTLEQQTEACRFVVSTPQGNSQKEYAVGKVSYSTFDPPPQRNLDKIRSACRVDERAITDLAQVNGQALHLKFGPRWQNIRHVYVGESEALAALELPSPYVTDLGDFLIHPALLDMATGFGLMLVPDYDANTQFFVPLSYKRVRYYAPVPQRIWSHIRYLDYANHPTDVQTFDITLMDEQGNVLLEIDDFTVKRVDQADLQLTSDLGSAHQGGDADELADSPMLALAQTEGITPEEGVEVFQRVLAGGTAPQVIASSLDMHGLAKFVATMNEPPEPTITVERSDDNGSYIAPRNPVEQQLADIWSSLLGIKQISVDDNFFDLGGHSLLAVRLFAQIRKAYNLSFSLAVLYEAGTIAQLADMIIAEVGLTSDQASSAPRAVKKGWSSLVTINKGNPDRPKFFCVHDLNGHVLYYRDLAKALGTDQPFYALQARGQDGKEDLDTSIDVMATRYLKDIRKEQPTGPYYLGGSSLGGMVAFEIAQQLRAAGERVSLVAMFDSWTPDYRAEVVSWEERTLSQKIAHHLDQIKTQGVAYFADRARSRVEWLQYKVEATRQRGIRLVKNVWLRTGQPLPEYLLTFHREETYGNMYDAYQPQPYDGKLTLFRATERSAKDQFDPTLGWNDIGVGEIEVIESPGEHGWMVREPHAEVLAVALRDCIDRAAGISQPTEAGQ